MKKTFEQSLLEDQIMITQLRLWRYRKRNCKKRTDCQKYVRFLMEEVKNPPDSVRRPRCGAIMSNQQAFSLFQPICAPYIFRPVRYSPVFAFPWCQALEWSCRPTSSTDLYSLINLQGLAFWGASEFHASHSDLTWQETLCNTNKSAENLDTPLFFRTSIYQIWI